MPEKKALSIDEELKIVKEMNKGVVDPDDTKPEEKKEETPPAEKPEEKKPVEEKKPEEKPASEKPEEPVKKEEEKPEVTPTPRQRPETYVPVEKYTSEKREWKTKEESLNNRIKELEAIKADTKKDSVQEDDEINAYAEKYGVDPEFVKGILNMARKGLEIPKDKLEAIDAANKIAQETAEKDYFSKEWTSVEPSIKSQFPDATPEQLGAAKELLDKISHTKKYAAYDLDYIIFKEKAQFDSILSKEEKKPEEPKQKTMEAGRQPGSGGPKPLTGADFKEEKDFSKLDSLPEDEKSKVISSFDPLTYERYVKFETYREDQGIEIDRGGRKIKLK